MMLRRSGTVAISVAWKASSVSSASSASYASSALSSPTRRASLGTAPRSICSFHGYSRDVRGEDLDRCRDPRNAVNRIDFLGSANLAVAPVTAVTRRRASSLAASSFSTSRRYSTSSCNSSLTSPIKRSTPSPPVLALSPSFCCHYHLSPPRNRDNSCRWFGSKSKKNKRRNAANKGGGSKGGSNSSSKQKTFPARDSRIQSRPPGEKEVDTKFPLPDKDKEAELSTLQSRVQELYRTGDYSEALKISLDLLDETEKHFGAGHPATASSYNNVGLFNKLLGKFDDSRKYYLKSLKLYKKAVGEDHGSYASILHNIGNLNRNQVHFDPSLKATERLSLMEQSADYLERAHKIRCDELGHDHPHTVSSRSCWGTTLAEQILHNHKVTSPETSDDTGTHGGATNPNPAETERIKQRKRYYVSILPTDVTLQGWDAAEGHLREALKTAIDNPRGKRLPKPDKKSKKAANAAARKRGKVRKATTSSKSTDDDKDAHQIETLSAASAGQNLAIFLKVRATTETPYNKDWLDESYRMYQQVLNVRNQLLPPGHPDLYATKHSIAELLDAMGDEEGANAVRQEIVDTYDPPPEPEDAGAGDQHHQGGNKDLHQRAEQDETQQDKSNTE